MAVRDRAWHPWRGRSLGPAHRILVVARYGARGALASRSFLALLAVCGLPSVAAAVAVWFSHNTSLIPAPAVTEWLAGVPDWVFLRLFTWQATAAALITVLAGPRLMVADLANRGLDLILARPITARGYLVGKVAALFVLTSPVTWMAGLGVILVHGVAAGAGWWWDGLQLALAYFVGHVAWILVISLLTLAVSAWIGQAPLARILLLATFFLLSSIGGAVNLATGTALGEILDPLLAATSVVRWLFGQATPSQLPVAANWATLATVVVASWVVLHRRISWEGSRR